MPIKNTIDIRFKLDPQQYWVKHWGLADASAFVARSLVNRTEGVPLGVKSHEDHVYSVRVLVCPMAYRLFSDFYDAFIQELHDESVDSGRGVLSVEAVPAEKHRT